MALGAVAHRQHVVGPPRGLRPGRRERRVQADLAGVAQRAQPRVAVRERPHRVEHAGEQHVLVAALVVQEVREAGCSSRCGRAGTRAASSARSTACGAAACATAAGMNLFQALGDTPPSVPTAPVSTLSSHRLRVICQPCRLPAAAARQMCEQNAGARRGDLARDRDDGRGGHPGLLLGELGGVARVLALELGDEVRERRLGVRARGGPGSVRQLTQRRTNSRSIAVLLEQDARDRQQQRGLGAGPGRAASSRRESPCSTAAGR